MNTWIRVLQAEAAAYVPGKGAYQAHARKSKDGRVALTDELGTDGVTMRKMY